MHTALEHVEADARSSIKGIDATVLGLQRSLQDTKKSTVIALEEFVASDNNKIKQAIKNVHYQLKLIRGTLGIYLEACAAKPLVSF
ncbi:hypothetical protein SERLADRAFT_434299 [Serpula lacrymans var. lacrymans S7.9]|uniref:Uncharacterized protein n=1 Tax=Serpula lacrymans var. lacrymans (strain S7.9) TaxID=578457 RepID=F8NKC0_SERL9|nr:uncharacterized protein SERLADRAFT_434299 [Serpula lacrymans var. lacrymans S7.9]EGO28386.1 hypothetical protein SERLADRAFT_434299 [Serpula lacrymans var. lacrymans S7.9]